MAKLILFLSLLGATAGAAELPTMYCQFWNSITHDVTSHTLVADFPAGSLFVKFCMEQEPKDVNTAGLGFCMSFTRPDLNSAATQFVGDLYRLNPDGPQTALEHYVRDVSQLENIAISAEAGRDLYATALCSPQ